MLNLKNKDKAFILFFSCFGVHHDNMTYKFAVNMNRIPGPGTSNIY